MAIYLGNNKVSGLYLGNKPIKRIYRGYNSVDTGNANTDLKLRSSIYINNGSTPENPVQSTQMVNSEFSNSDSRNVIKWIRENSHLYVGKYYGSEVGMVIKQLSDTNKAVFKDGTPAVIDNTPDALGIIGDVFLRMPTFYYKAVSSENNVTQIIFSTYNDKEGTFTKWDTNNLIGVYEGIVLDDSNNRVTSLFDYYYDGYVLHSISMNNSPSSLCTVEVFKQAARARNTTDTTDNFSLVTYQAHVVMALLYYGWYHDTNALNTIGIGVENYDVNIGLTNSLGMTDTTPLTGNNSSTNFWGLENWISSKKEFIDNIEIEEDTDNINILDYNGNIVRTIQSHITGQSGFVLRMIMDSQSDGACDLIPDMVKSSPSNIGYACYGNISNSSNYAACRGGTGGGTGIGVGSLEFYALAAGWIGSRLMYSGKITDVTDTEAAYIF